MQHITIVVLGDEGVGKSSFLISCHTNSFPNDRVIERIENVACNYMVDKQPLALHLWEMEDSPNVPTDVYLLCFDLTSPSSLENAKKKWFSEAKRRRGGKVVMLIGLKLDLRGTEEGTKVCAEEGKEAAERLKCDLYLECSALTQQGLKEVFDSAVRCVFAKNQAAQRSGGFFSKIIKKR
jgi:Ras-related C3 botulinum toxin substrate 1